MKTTRTTKAAGEEIAGRLLECGRCGAPAPLPVGDDPPCCRGCYAAGVARTIGRLQQRLAGAALDPEADDADREDLCLVGSCSSAPDAG